MIYENKIFYGRNMLPPELPFKIYKCEGQLTQPNHTHDYIQMWYVKRGECVHYFNGCVHKLSRGDIFVLPKGVYHSIDAENDDTVLYGVEFTEDFISEDMQSSRNRSFSYGYIQPFIVSVDEIKPMFTLAGNTVKTVETLLEELLFEFDEKQKYYALFIKANLLKILAIITREYNKSVKKESKAIAERYRASIVKGIDYINENFRTKIYLEEMCRLTMMSPAYFSYIFKYVTGRTFTEYTSHLRIEEAKKLLRESDRSVNLIANTVGFCDTASFDRAFKKEVGMTPFQYRRESGTEK